MHNPQGSDGQWTQHQQQGDIMRHYLSTSSKIIEEFPDWLSVLVMGATWQIHADSIGRDHTHMAAGSFNISAALFVILAQSHAASG